MNNRKENKDFYTELKKAVPDEKVRTEIFKLHIKDIEESVQNGYESGKSMMKDYLRDFLKML